MKLFDYFVYELKLKYKLLISFLVVLIVPMIILFLYFEVYFVQRLESTTLSMEITITDQIKGNVEAVLSKVSSAADGVSQQELFQELLRTEDTQYQAFLTEHRDAVNTYMDSIGSGVDGGLIQGIRIYLPQGHPLISRRLLKNSDYFENAAKIKTSLWYGMLSTSEQMSLTASTYYLNSWEITNLGSLSYIRKIPYYVGGERQEAYVCVYYNKEYMSHILQGYGDYPQSCIYILDEKESLVDYYGQNTQDRFLLSYDSIEDYLLQEGMFYQVDYGNHLAWSIYENIPFSDWKLVFTVTKDSITASTRRDGWYFMAIYSTTALLVFALIALMIQKVTGRLTLLQDQMKGTEAEPPKRVEGAVHGDEIGELTREYNEMTDQIRRLMQETVELQKEKNGLEMNMLRAQINPHFLYNTLDMISWYAMKGQTEDVTATIQSLARFYRLSLNGGHLITTLENEFLLTEKYLELQNRRSHGQVELLIDVPDEMLEQRVPQLFLQPLVENSLKHGIFEKETPEGYISISGWLEEEAMVLILADDGVGMGDVEVEELLKAQEDSESLEKEGHIGIRNIYRRLLLLYGKDNFSMTYHSSREEGTQVELRIPISIQKEEF